MSGVFALVEPTVEAVELAPLLERVSAASFSAGPRVWSSSTSGPCALGVLSHATPACFQRRCVTSTDGRYILAFEGEIYNAEALRMKLGLTDLPRQDLNTDPSEVVLRAFVELGVGALPELNGLFQLALWDSQEQELVVANDVGGLRPIYLVQEGRRFAFAPEVKCLLHLPWVSRQPDAAGLLSFLQHGYPMGDRTFFRQVRLLDAGSYARVGRVGVSMQRYWRMPLASKLRVSENEALELFADTWRAVIRDQTNDTLRVGTFLSGGLDSRVILAGLLDAGRLSSAFTFGEENCTDVAVARSIADVANCSHCVKELSVAGLLQQADAAVQLTDGMFNWFHASVFQLNDELRQRVDVVTDGINMVDGYYYSLQACLRSFLPIWDTRKWVRLAMPSDWDLHAFAAGGGSVVRLLNPSSCLGECRFDLNAYLDRYIDSVKSETVEPISILHLFDQEIRQRRFTSNGPNLSRAAVPVRCPLFDKRVLELGARLPHRFRCKDKRLQIYGVQSLAPELTTVRWGLSGRPIDGSKKLLYTALALRLVAKKLGRLTAEHIPALHKTGEQAFPVDYDRLLRTSAALQDLIRSRLIDRSANASGFFDPVAVEELLSCHLQARGHHAEIFGRMLTVEMWHRLFAA